MAVFIRWTSTRLIVSNSACLLRSVLEENGHVTPAVRERVDCTVHFRLGLAYHNCGEQHGMMQRPRNVSLFDVTIWQTSLVTGRATRRTEGRRHRRFQVVHSRDVSSFSRMNVWHLGKLDLSVHALLMTLAWECKLVARRNNELQGVDDTQIEVRCT